MPEIYGTDAYSPPQIAEKIEAVGVKKAHLPLVQMAALGVLAGGFIGLGAVFSTVVFSDPALPFALARVLGGLVFSLGLILVVIAGAELFTGNNLMVMAWVRGSIPTGLLLRNFVVVYIANLAGAAGLAVLVWLSDHASLGDIGGTAVKIAATKVALPFATAFFRGVLCNLLVCLAVWLAMAGRSVTDKILAIVFPITAFVACGFEHCVANMYLIPLGMLLAPAEAPITLVDFGRNLLPVTLGNLFGGAGMVGLVYYLIYGRDRPQSS
jgi:formate transporter